MTYNEFKILVKGMKAVYTQPTFLPDADAIKIWYQLLQDIDYQAANAAVQKYMLTSKFPPTIADIREHATSIVKGEIPLWSAGWEQVLRAIRMYGSYNESAALAYMDEITAETVKRLGYGELCQSENIMADRANFRLIFEQISERKKKNDQLPEALTNMISNLRDEEKKKLVENMDVLVERLSL